MNLGPVEQQGLDAAIVSEGGIWERAKTRPAWGKAPRRRR
jgi:hypothetical protein